MENLVLHKVRLSVLWLFDEGAYLVVLVLTLMAPGVIDQIRMGEVIGMKIGPELLLMFAIMLLVPLVMAFLSLTLKDSINRWANMILGIVFAGLELSSLFGELAHLSAYEILVRVSVVVALALIVWYAWKWPKKKD